MAEHFCQSSSDASCGWAAALLSTLAFGSFAVPIKSPTCIRLKIDPLVFQTYKTVMNLITSFCVIQFMGDRSNMTFSPWGIVSGLFWVPSGVAAVYAVQHAGLAVSQGTWSSLIVLVSFVWGFGVFGEEVYSMSKTGLAIALMVIGLWGMSFFSVPTASTSHQYHGHDHTEEAVVNGNLSRYVELPSANHDDDDPFKLDGFQPDMADFNSVSIQNVNSYYLLTNATLWSDRTKGLLAATFNGLWGGSVMVPMHYSTGTGGFRYVMSFALGATIVTCCLWIVRWIYNFMNMTQSSSYPNESLFIRWKRAYQQLPAFYISQMIIPGGTAGFIWSVGNISSMISVNALGEGIGYSVVQSAMLVSGVWGILWFREISDIGNIIKWFMAAMTTAIGIILLSYQHVKEE